MSVQVLLSTFNGEKYLLALLDSLARQNFDNIDILVRDDGSKDGTRSLIQEYAQRARRLQFIGGEHVGFVQSFFQLAARASATAHYYAFCDQDDVWQPDKIARAVALLAHCAPDAPTLYCSRQNLVDPELRPLGLSSLPCKPLSFRNALVECPTVGCTVVFNRALRQLLLRQMPQRAISHDWWLYMLASAFGKVIYDAEARILYRKHGANAVGVTIGAIETWKVKITRFLEDGKLHLIVNQAEEFRRIYGSLLGQEHRLVIDRLLGSRKPFWRRLAYAVTADVYRQSALDQILLKARIACDRI